MGRIECEAMTMGKVLGYTKGWNPISTETKVLVYVENKTIKIPIDYRQQRFIQKENPPGAIVSLGLHDGKWCIGSRPVSTAELKTGVNYGGAKNYRYL